MHQIFSSQLNDSISETSIKDKDEIHHFKNVLRLKKGDKVKIFNGEGVVADGELTNLTATQATFNVSNIKQANKPKPEIILACAIPKKSKFETIIEKTTELGISKIIPLITERTAFTIKGDTVQRKMKRFNTVGLSATKQSKRAFLPVIETIQSLDDCLKQYAKDSTVIVPALIGNTKPLLSTLDKIKSQKPDRIIFFIGPEGDFADAEYEAIFAQNAHPVTLGPTILRVETAAISAISAANLTFYV